MDVLNPPHELFGHDGSCLHFVAVDVTEVIHPHGLQSGTPSDELRH